MTKAERLRLSRPGLLTALFLLAFSASAGDAARGGRESVRVLREAPLGPILVAYASAPMTPDTPPDGVRTALGRAIGAERVSAACFYWEERDSAMEWIRGQMEERRKRGFPPRIILAGHGLGATEASETARELLFHERDFAVALLLTVDAVKTSRYGGPAYAAGNAIVNSLPGLSHSFTAYDAAPSPDGRSVWAHINYYQNNFTTVHGAAMPNAENHLIADWTGLLDHDNAADVVMPGLTADLRYAIRRVLSGGGGAGAMTRGYRAVGFDPMDGADSLRDINARNPEQRMNALRLASHRAGALRDRGDAAAARELEDIVIRRYFVEPDQEVRACVVQICAPATGRSAAMVRFLRGRIAGGEFPGYAALSLAAMAPKSAFEDIEPLTEHPAPDVRLQAATALTVLGEPRGFESVRRVWLGMEPGLWPEEIEGVAIRDARAGLAAQARRAFGRDPER